MRSRRNLEFESTDSEDELPKVDRHYKPTFEKQDFLKMFQQKNAIHSGDRENFAEISCNMVRDKKVLQKNKFFKKPNTKEPKINLNL